jgi:hypothetical protein
MGSNIPLSASAQRTAAISAPTPYPYLPYAKSSIEFNPLLIQGCEVWLDAADPTTLSLTGSTVTAWRDKSTKAYTITVNSTPTYSSTGFNGGLPCVSFTTGVYLQTTLSSQVANSDFAIFAVWNQTVNGGVNSVVSIGAPTTETALGIHAIGSISYYNFYHYGIGDANTTQIYTYGVPVVHSGTRLSGVLTAYINGTASANTINDSANTSTSFYVSQPSGSGFPITGQVSEVLLYKATLTSTQRQQIEGYLASKWKLTSYLSPTQLYNTNSFLSIVNAPVMPTIPIRKAAQNNKFLPPQYSNCVLWLDATDVNGTGRNPATGTITSWTDKSGSGNSSTASGGTPTLTANSLNGKPGVAFSSASSSYIQVPRVVTSDWSIFIVFSTTQTGPNSTPTPGPGQAHTDASGNHWWGGQGIFDGEMAGSVNDMGISLCGSPTGYLGYGTGDLASGQDTTEFSATAVNTGAGFIGEFFRTQSSGNLQMFVNGAFQVSTTGGTANRVSPTLKIGAIQTLPAGYYFTGTVYEIVCYTRVLSTIERQQIEGYFAWKWGLKNSIGSGHPFFLVPPIPTPYQ